MNNQELLQKMKEDMEMRGFSHWTKESYELKAKDVMRYFKKPMEEVTTEELREYLLKYLKEERKLSERSVNYYRGKFLYYLKQEKLDFYGKNKYLENPASYSSLIQELYNKDWIVYCKEPFNNANCVIQYLGRYTHRVAISNERILDITDINEYIEKIETY